MVSEDEAPRAGVVTPARVVLAGVLYLVVVWVAVYAVDVTGVVNLDDHIQRPLWILLFHESHLTEQVQWLLLGTSAVVAGHLGGRLRRSHNHRFATFWAVLAPGLALMVIEDAGNPRHSLGVFAERVLGIPSFTANALILATIALVMLYALAAHWRVLRGLRPFRDVLLAAYAVYGLAGALSATGPRWYPRAGGALNDLLFAGRLPIDEAMVPTREFLIMDLMIEESVELIGATLFLAAAVAFTQWHRAHDRGDQVREGLTTTR